MFTIIVLTSSSKAVELGERVLTSIRLVQFFASQWVEQWSDHTATHGSGVSFPNLWKVCESFLAVGLELQ
jgi:hypothetical protein